MGKTEVIVGNKAVAYGAKLSRVEVISAYPVTPQTTIVHYLADFIASGEMNAKFIEVESEMSAQVSIQGASFAGARAFTATSGPGLLYMHHPMMGCQLPVVMAVVHRGNKSMQPDHTDLMAQRDTGWIQLYCENNQEVLDTCIMAYKIAEDNRVYLPVAIGLDGYILSYTAEPVNIPNQEDVDRFLPSFKSRSAIDPTVPYNEWVKRTQRYRGTQEAWLMHHKNMMNATEVICEVDGLFNKTFGRSYGGIFEEYNCEGAEAVIVGMGTIASTARPVIDELRQEGKKVGLIKLKTFRPFPADEFRNLAKKYHAIGVIDRNISIGGGGVVFSEVRNALYDMHPLKLNLLWSGFEVIKVE
jgi:pyruvate ferredoxin oxidoreductase alpha subunit